MMAQQTDNKRIVKVKNDGKIMENETEKFNRIKRRIDDILEEEKFTNLECVLLGEVIKLSAIKQAGFYFERNKKVNKCVMI